MPSLIIVQLFRRSRNRQSRKKKLKEFIESKLANNLKMKTRQKTEVFDNIQTARSMSGRRSHRANLVPELEENDRKEIKVDWKMKLKRLTIFPWWFKIVAYSLSFAIAVVSIVFIIFKGISLGDDKVKRWLTSFLVSVLTSIFLTQPLQVKKIKN